MGGMDLTIYYTIMSTTIDTFNIQSCHRDLNEALLQTVDSFKDSMLLQYGSDYTFIYNRIIET